MSLLSTDILPVSFENETYKITAQELAYKIGTSSSFLIPIRRNDITHYIDLDSILDDDILVAYREGFGSGRISGADLKSHMKKIGNLTIEGEIIPKIGNVIIEGVIRDHPYIEAVEAADGEPLEPAVKAAMADLIADLQATTGYAAMESFIPGIGGRTLAGGMVPLIGPSPVLYNFTAGDYDRKLGTKGGSNKGLMVNVACGEGSLDFHASFYCTENTPGAFADLLGKDKSGPSLTIRASASLISFYVNTQTATRSLPESILPGFIGGALSPLLSEEAWTDVVSTDTGNQPGTTPPGPPIGFLCRANITGTDIKNSASARGFGFSAGYYYDQPMEVRAALIKYQAALAVAIPDA
jgi:hypothetical protein